MMGISGGTSNTCNLICPVCEAGVLREGVEGVLRCGHCEQTIDGAMLRTLLRIVSLPDVIGSHACEECGHPEMRRLPDRVFWCPACGSEVLPP